MIYLLYAFTFVEAVVILSLLFKTPVRKLVIAGLDRIKRGQGPIVVKTVALTVLVVLSSTLYLIVKIRPGDDGDVSATDQILLGRHLLEVTLMGISLFLALLTDRLHHYIRELRLRRKTMEVGKTSSTEVKHGPEDFKARDEQVGTFKEIIRQLEAELSSKAQEVDSAEANIQSLKKQSEGLLLEYDRLLAENQEFRTQLESLEQRLSLSPVKKSSP